MKHLHVPLAEDLHEALMAEARRSGESATAIARRAIERAVRDRRHRAALQDETAAYAERYAGSEFDLDPDLEMPSRAAP